MGHEINSIETIEKIEKICNSPEIQSLDLSMFGEQDYVNMVLQRSEILYDIARPNQAIRAWSLGDDAPLKAIAEKLGVELARRTIAYIKLEYDEPELQKLLKSLKPKSMADIGCGYAFFDYFLAKDFNPEINLIDIETSVNRNFGFKATGAGYTNLDRAREFLTANGVDNKKIHTLDPNKDDLSKLKDLDLSVSFLSCGFHYPETTYENFFGESVADNGVIILDRRLRRVRDHHRCLEKFGEVKTLPFAHNAHRAYVIKQAT